MCSQYIFAYSSFIQLVIKLTRRKIVTVVSCYSFYVLLLFSRWTTARITTWPSAGRTTRCRWSWTTRPAQTTFSLNAQTALYRYCSTLPLLVEVLG